jgi:hypothetical protein
MIDNFVFKRIIWNLKIIVKRKIMNTSIKIAGRKLFIVLTLIFSSIIWQSCSSEKEESKNFDSFYEKNKDKPHVTCFSVPVSLVKMVVIGNDAVKEILNHVDEVKFITYEGKTDSVSLILGELKQCLPSTVYTDLFDVKKGDDNVDVKVREEASVVKEGIMLSADTGSFFAVSLKGQLDIEKVKKLAESIDLNKLKDLAKGSIF